MDINKIFTKAIIEKPNSNRPSGKKLLIKSENPIRMGFNENPYPVPKKIEDIQIREASRGNYYGDFQSTQMKWAIAKHFGVTPENVITGAGSSPLIDTIAQAFIEKGDETLLCYPTFEAFIDSTYARGGVVVKVPVKAEDMTYDLDALADAITDKTKLIIICNPNNPTGGYVGIDAIEAFVQKVPENVVIVFDEAYIDFATAADCKSTIPLIEKYPEKPIIVLRTFSKYYGMAGIRAGYMIAGKELITVLNKVPRCMVSRAAQACAVAAFDEIPYYEECKKKIVAGREYIEQELANLGCKAYHSETNFVLFNAYRDPAQVCEKLAERGILISRIAEPALCRVSVSTEENNHLFIQELREILGEMEEKKAS